MVSLRLKRKKAQGNQSLLAKDLKKENSQIRGTPLICSETKILKLRVLPLFVIKQKWLSKLRALPLFVPQIKILKLGVLPLFAFKKDKFSN